MILLASYENSLPLKIVVLDPHCLNVFFENFGGTLLKKTSQVLDSSPFFKSATSNFNNSFDRCFQKI